LRCIRSSYSRVSSNVAQADLQFRRIEMRMPRPHRLAGIVQHTHQIDRQRADIARARV